MSRRTTRHHGLTLLEVLAATALLSILALASMPLLRSAGESSAINHEPLDSDDVTAELRTLADAIADHPELVGCQDRKELVGVCTVSFTWPAAAPAVEPSAAASLMPPAPEGFGDATVRLTILNASPSAQPSSGDSKSALDHAWLELECGGCRVIHWLKLPPPTPPPPPLHSATPEAKP